MNVSEFDIFTPGRRIIKGEPAWDLALLFPVQGHWTEEQYLSLTTNRLVELVDGCLEVLPMPTILHQTIVRFLFKLLDQFVAGMGTGEVFFAPLRIRLWPGTIREPDIVYLTHQRIRDSRQPPEGADLAMEVVSAGGENRRRDLETKPREYARAGIQEYWIVDPEKQCIIVLTLEGEHYRVHGEFETGSLATSSLLPGFAVDVAAVFAGSQGAK